MTNEHFRCDCGQFHDLSQESIFCPEENLQDGLIVERDYDKKRFIATKDDLWRTRLDEWRKDTSKPCPMPLQHIMFRPGALHYHALNRKSKEVAEFSLPFSGE